MPISLPRALNLPPTGWTLAGLLAFYVLAGLFGHDPWKSEDVIHLSVARDFLDPDQGSGLFLAGQPFFSGPLFYWSAAGTGRLLGHWLPLHDALRFASGLWMALTLIALYYAAREYHGKENAAAAPLLLAGSFGLIVCAHEAQPLLTLLAASSCQFLAVGLFPRKPRVAAFLLACALAIAGAGAGLVGLFLFGVSLLPALFYHRTRFLFPLCAGLAGGLFLLGLTALLLMQTAPIWFQAWVSHERARFPMRAYSGELLALLRMQPWFSWPLLPLSCWSLWQKRRQGQWRHPDVLFPLLAFLALLFGLPLVFHIEEHTAMLLLPPLALLATPGTLSLRRGAANAFDWFSGMAFSVFVLLLWIGWIAMVFGWPERLAERAVVLAPGFTGTFDPLFFTLALAVTTWWIWSLAGLPRSAYRCLTRWTTGLVIGWLLAVLLWLPWIDYGKSYRQLAHDLARQLPELRAQDCVAEMYLGFAQRASFSYFERLEFTPVDARGRTGCRWLLIQGGRAEPRLPEQRWQKIWEGSRPGDRRERFRLYELDGKLVLR
ncbi:MAG: hypothetical protein LBO79_10955 [Zoogloeaceae bacterium]|jgi:4-amino-4-deoxy-L-arabinose transferase-like glycosyltransferase|nr:hypothetical protein [Zoogloeaceae bacterium]